MEFDRDEAFLTAIVSLVVYMAACGCRTQRPEVGTVSGGLRELPYDSVLV